MQATQEGYKDVVRSCREKIRKAKAQIELNLSTSGKKKNNSCFYKYVISQRIAKDILHPFLDLGGNTVTKAEILCAFFASVFSSKTSCCLDPLIWKAGTGSSMKTQNPRGNHQEPTSRHTEFSDLHRIHPGCSGSFPSPFPSSTSAPG